jgi:hypothetical protein
MELQQSPGISAKIVGMSLSVARISDLVVDQLSRREMRLLSLVVAVRKGLTTSEGFKGDLTVSVKTALRELVAAQTVVDEDGIYSLATPRHAGPGRLPAHV